MYVWKAEQPKLLQLLEFLRQCFHLSCYGNLL